MPRVPFSLIRAAQRENYLLPILLKECRTLDSARNELRWLRERAVHSQSLPRSKTGWRERLESMCQMRSQGVPLQYILGDQPFGDLEILCRRGVLIPRPETESYTYQAARLVQSLTQDQSNADRLLRVIDLCTGTGCIPLLLHALLAPHFERLKITGVDISLPALSLAQENLKHNMQLGHLAHTAMTDIRFHRADVLAHGIDGIDSIPSIEAILQTQLISDQGGCDLLISNPPYISQTDYRNGTTARSVRRFEPQLALVPPLRGDEDCRPEDIFYHRILTLALKLKAKITVLECGDILQANRVIDLHQRLASVESGQFSAQVWPRHKRDLAQNGFHVTDGSRGVIIQRL